MKIRRNGNDFTLIPPNDCVTADSECVKDFPPRTGWLPVITCFRNSNGGGSYGTHVAYSMIERRRQATIAGVWKRRHTNDHSRESDKAF
jgi:hypothetical protein